MRIYRFMDKFHTFYEVIINIYILKMKQKLQQIMKSLNKMDYGMVLKAILQILLLHHKKSQRTTQIYGIQKKLLESQKTDLKIRPIHHYLKHRIEAHVSISFIAYTIYKELERILKLHDKTISVQKALEEIKTIYGLEYINPITNERKFEVLKLNETQQKIQNIIDLELG